MHPQGQPEYLLCLSNLKIRLEHFLWDGPKPTPPVQPALPAIPVPEEPTPAKKSTSKKKK
jgi:hypothetical protein